MSSGVKGAIRVSIPSNVKNTIENLKEMTGQNHTDDEIYDVLKECSMDPNETAQKLLLLDKFHEVKRKRDRRKENLNKEPTELRWNPGTQARAKKGTRGNYSSRYTSHDVDGGKSSSALKETVTDHLTVKGVSKVPLTTAPEMKKNEIISVTSPITDVSNGPSSITYQGKQEVTASASGSVNQSKAAVNASMCNLEAPLPISSPIDSIKKACASETGNIHQQQIMGLKNSNPIASETDAGSYNSISDPVLFPSQDLPLPTAVGSISREVGSPHAHAEVIAENITEFNLVSAGTSASESGSSNMQQKIPNELHVVGKNQHVEFLQIGSSTTGVSSVSRPSSNYNNRSQMIGPQKVGAGKEWKPKSTSSSSIGQVAATSFVSEVSMNSPESQPIPIVIGSIEATLELQRKLEDSHISDVQHVIIPNHLHVPETEKLWFRFGSFDANFNLDKSHNGWPESDETQPLSESYEAIDESLKEPPLSNQNAVTVVKDSEIRYPDEHQSPSQGPENFSSSEGEAPPSIIPEYSKSKQEVTPGSHQYNAVHTSSNYNFGFIPPVLSGQVSSLESSDAQARDAPRLPGFAVQQPLDPTNYYGQFYRSSIDGDGRISPFNPSVTANKYTGSASLSQSPQEGGVPFILSNSPTPLVTQAAGVMQNSVTATQQPLPVFRQPTGVHIPHYPPNYMPYGPYFSPFYVPPQAILQFLSNGAFPHQPQAGNMYPTPPGTTAKYPVSQYNQGSNTGSSTQIVMPGSFGPYDHTMANYTSSSATAAVSSTANEDFSASQIKENIYASGQQSEGSGVWFTAPSRDISNLQTSSFYNLPRGQLAFTPTQPGPGTFTSIFHPAQAVTAATVHPLLQQSQSITTPADIVGPTAHVFQQPQHTQLNWPTNY